MNVRTFLTLFILGLSKFLSSQKISGILLVDSVEVIPFANIAAYQNSTLVACVSTDMDGRFVLKDLNFGFYKIVFGYAGYCFDTSYVQITAGESKQVKLTLRNKCPFYLDEIAINRDSTNIHLTFSDITVPAFIQLLKVKSNNKNKVIHVLPRSIGQKWINASDIPYLITLIDSEEESKCVSFSTNCPKFIGSLSRSTIGRQTMNLIDAYRLHDSYYPYFDLDCGGNDSKRAAEIREWWKVYESRLIKKQKKN